MVKGLNNIGNTCYLNSGLQMILHNDELCNLIVKNKLLNSNFEILANFIIEYNNNNNTISPQNIKQLIENKNNMFRGNRQHDSSEFLIFFLELITDDIKTELYEISTQISIKCKLRKCLNVSSHIEKSNILFLNINENFICLNDCYEEYISRYKFENDDDLYWCEKCRDKRIAVKKTNIINWPKHLIIVLKRFTQNNRKITNSINVPEYWINGYTLKGIIFHSGNPFGGHYIYIGKYNNNWYMFDDNFVNLINLQNLENFKNYGYIYYYEKL